MLDPIEGTDGYPLASKYGRDKNGKYKPGEPSDGWYRNILNNFDKVDHMLSFIVRDDSFRVFKIARALAWIDRIDVGYELLAEDEQIQFGAGGIRTDIAK